MVAGVLSSAIAVFFYIRIILMLFFSNELNDTVSVIIPSIRTRAAIAICALITVILGVAPSLLLNSAQTFANFLR